MNSYQNNLGKKALKFYGNPNECVSSKHRKIIYKRKIHTNPLCRLINLFALNQYIQFMQFIFNEARTIQIAYLRSVQRSFAVAIMKTESNLFLYRVPSKGTPLSRFETNLRDFCKLVIIVSQSIQFNQWSFKRTNE